MSLVAQQYPPEFNRLGLQQGQGISAPQESFTQVIDGSVERLNLIEQQVNEVINRLFNFPRGLQEDGAKAPVPPSVSERALDIRSRAIRINNALTTLLEKL